MRCFQVIIIWISQNKVKDYSFIVFFFLKIDYFAIYIRLLLTNSSEI